MDAGIKLQGIIGTLHFAIQIHAPHARAMHMTMLQNSHVAAALVATQLVQRSLLHQRSSRLQDSLVLQHSLHLLPLNN
jgi:hypothetical protein